MKIPQDFFSLLDNWFWIASGKFSLLRGDCLPFAENVLMILNLNKRDIFQLNLSENDVAIG